MIRAAAMALLLALTACAGFEKGSEAGLGLDAFTSSTKEEKENDKWFKSFYGKNHCYGAWASDCSDDEGGGGGGGGMWGGGVGPSSTNSGGGGNASATGSE
ncbi:MAG: hypothetical protein V4735_02305 [Pseudomonadota bacterium]